MKYYITDKTQPKGFIELSEVEYAALFGDDMTRPYAVKLYREETLGSKTVIEGDFAFAKRGTKKRLDIEKTCRIFYNNIIKSSLWDTYASRMISEGKRNRPNGK